MDCGSIADINKAVRRAQRSTSCQALEQKTAEIEYPKMDTQIDEKWIKMPPF